MHEINAGKAYWFGLSSLVNAFGDWISPKNHQFKVNMILDDLQCADAEIGRLNLENGRLKELYGFQEQSLPKFVQDGIMKLPENYSAFGAMSFIKRKIEKFNNDNENDEWIKLYEWLFDSQMQKSNQDVFANAWLLYRPTSKGCRFYLKHIEMSKRDTYHDYYAQIRNERFEHNSVETGMLPQPEISGVRFTQEEINNMEAGSYEQIPVEDE